jgi:hypothetical protein
MENLQHLKGTEFDGMEMHEERTITVVKPWELQVERVPQGYVMRRMFLGQEMFKQEAFGYITLQAAIATQIEQIMEAYTGQEEARAARFQQYLDEEEES